MFVGGLVRDLAECLGLVAADAGLGVVAKLGCGVVLGRGLRAILEIDRVCWVQGGMVPEVSVGDRWVRYWENRGGAGGENVPVRKLE